MPLANVKCKKCIHAYFFLTLITLDKLPRAFKVNCPFARPFEMDREKDSEKDSEKAIVNAAIGQYDTMVNKIDTLTE